MEEGWTLMRERSVSGRLYRYPNQMLARQDRGVVVVGRLLPLQIHSEGPTFLASMSSMSFNPPGEGSQRVGRQSSGA